MLRFLVAAAIAVFATQFPSNARASTIEYDLTFTPTSGSIGGTGYFDVNSPLNGSGVDAITALSVSIDNALFTLGDEQGTATATFSNGLLSNLNYVGALVDGINLDILGTGGLTYSFLDIGTSETLASGTISAVDPPSAAPLPTSVILFATGLLALLFLTYRRRASATCKIA